MQVQHNKTTSHHPHTDLRLITARTERATPVFMGFSRRELRRLVAEQIG
ncbi:hypothetical protein [Asticcacaulis sp. EMRT-3]|nr:hypothetical protein [Asticcacaulis sp. EMRT-3]MDI7774180.1 hypothetical protein [Asticcacaulis sp. EMRT-3]